jgi:2-iminobutanoate/2-iminopropanoate deaminase
MKKILSPNAPTPGGHYSQATVHNNTVYVSGLLPIKVGSPPDASLSFEDQVQLVLSHLGAILLEAGSSPDKVLKVSIFVSDIANWPKVDKVYKSFFGDHKPARIVVPVKDLHFGFGIELDAIAAI